MKKNKILYRCYVGGYFLWLFGVTLGAIMFVRLSVPFAIVMMVLAGIILAAEITSHVFYNKKREWFPIAALASQGAAATVIFLGFLLEVINAAQGKLGLYAIIVSSVCLFFQGIQALYLVPACLKMLKDAPKPKPEVVAEQPEEKK